VIVKINNIELEIPQLLINKFYKDFEGLPGGKHYESIIELRDSIDTVFDIAAVDPELMDNPAFQLNIVRAMAMMCAMKKHGIYYDA